MPAADRSMLVYNTPSHDRHLGWLGVDAPAHHTADQRQVIISIGPLTLTSVGAAAHCGTSTVVYVASFQNAIINTFQSSKHTDNLRYRRPLGAFRIHTD